MIFVNVSALYAINNMISFLRNTWVLNGIHCSDKHCVLKEILDAFVGLRVLAFPESSYHILANRSSIKVDVFNMIHIHLFLFLPLCRQKTFSSYASKYLGFIPSAIKNGGLSALY